MSQAIARSYSLPIDQIQAFRLFLNRLVEHDPIPYGRFVEEMLARYAHHHKNSVSKMRQSLRELGDLLPEQRSTGDITPELIEAFARREGRASTTNGLLASLRIALKHATKKGWVSPGLVAECRFSVRDLDPCKQKHHSMDAIAKVIHHLESKAVDWKGERLLAFALILAYCGVRRGEALRLKVEDCHDGFLYVGPNGGDLKTPGSQAPVPIPEKIIPFLEQWKVRCGSEWLIPTQWKIRPWWNSPTDRRPGALLRKAGEEVGVKGFTPSSLRHSLTTHLVGRLGLSTKQVQMILRHSNQYTQKYYIHADLINLRDMVRDFDFDGRKNNPR